MESALCLKMNEKTKRAIKQLNALKKIDKKRLRLAAEWNEDWKILISTILSSQTRDEKTIEISKKLYKKYDSPKKLGNAPLKTIEKIIRPINFYRTKSKNIKKSAKIISKKGIPFNLKDLLELPGIGRKVANVYLAVQGKNAIGVDTHVSRISQKLGWTKNKNKYKIEQDLEKLFPKKYWRSINYILVNFGRLHWTRKKDEDAILKKIKQIK